MSHSKNIWFNVHGTGLKTDPSFGGNDCITQTIRVGTGVNNSHAFADIQIQRVELAHSGHISFNMYVDGHRIKSVRYDQDWELRTTKGAVHLLTESRAETTQLQIENRKLAARINVFEAFEQRERAKSMAIANNLSVAAIELAQTALSR